MRVGSLRAVAGNRDVYELRVDLFQILVAKTVLLGRARPEVLTEDIGACDQLAQNFSTLRGLEIEGDAFHAAVVGLEERARMAWQHRHDTRAVAALRRLDLDDLGAEISHQHVGHRAGLGRRAGNDFHALQRAIGIGHGSPPFLNLVYAFDKSLAIASLIAGGIAVGRRESRSSCTPTCRREAISRPSAWCIRWT